MDTRAFRVNVLLVILAYALLIVGGVVLRFSFPRADAIEYTVFKDMIPLSIAIPAAWLGYCFQRRQSYLKDVRDLWSKVVPAVQDAIQYTFLQSPSQSQFGEVQKSLSCAIEEIRAVFSNIGESEYRIGLYPFEGVKEIYSTISALGFGESVSPEKSKMARSSIVETWKRLRRRYLSEVARGIPIKPDSPYLS